MYYTLKTKKNSRFLYTNVQQKHQAFEITTVDKSNKAIKKILIN